MSNHSIITLEQTLMIKMWKFSFKINTWKCVQWCLGENGLSDYSGGTAISIYIASCWVLFKVLEQIQATACMYKIIIKSAKSALWFYFSLRTNTRYLWTFAIFIIIYTKNMPTRHSVQNEKYKYLTCLHVTLNNSVFFTCVPCIFCKTSAHSIYTCGMFVTAEQKAVSNTPLMTIHWLLKHARVTSHQYFFNSYSMFC